MKNKTNPEKRNFWEVKYLKKDQWLRLIESVDSYRDKLIVKLLYSTGMEEDKKREEERRSET